MMSHSDSTSNMSKTDCVLCDSNTPVKDQNICQPFEVVPDVSYLNENLVKTDDKLCTSPQLNVPSEEVSVDVSEEEGAFKKPYKCTICSRQFRQKLVLKRHILTHTGEKPYSCTFCKKRFSQLANRNLHLRIHTGEHSHKCSICCEGFTRSDALQRHMVVHTGVLPFGCSVCPKRFMRSTSVKRHMRLHVGENSNKGYASTKGVALTTSYFGDDRDPMNARVKTKSIIVPNVPRDSNVPVESVKSAQLVDVGFRDIDDLKEHLVSTDKSTSSHPCTGSTSNTDSVLCDSNTPMKSQNVYQPFEVVPDVSYLSENLVKTEDEMCTSTQFNVPSGEVSVDLSQEEGAFRKPFKCTICSRQFRQKIVLERHILTHTGEKPYSCTFCNKRFSQLANRNVHLMTAHTGDYPYKCSVCGRGFPRSDALQRHMVIHTRVPVECPVCHSRFMQSTYLKRHMRLHVGENLDKDLTLTASHVVGDSNQQKNDVTTNGIPPTNSTQMPSVTTVLCNGSKVSNDACISSIGHQDSTQLDQQMYMNTRVKTESAIALNVPRDSNVPVESVNSAQLEDVGCHDLDYLKKHLVSTDESISSKACTDSTLNMSNTDEATSLPHKCTFCNKQFPSPSALKLHMITHSDERPYKCSKCDKAYCRESNLTAHAKVHTRPKLYGCFNCDESFLYMHQLQKHLLIHVVENPDLPLWGNKAAGHVNTVKDMDRAHMKEKQQNISVHSEWSHDLSPQDQHMATHGQLDLPHPLKGADESSSSDSCTDSTSNMSKTNSILCDFDTPGKGQNICQPIEVVPDVSYLNENLIKTDDISCTSAQFNVPSEQVSVNLSEDEKNGAFEKRFKCSTCSRRFPVKRDLERHMFTHTGEKPHSCAYCNKRFSQIFNLTMHLRIHTGEHPYKCSVCGEGFTRSDALQRHMVIHTGVMPFGCSLCPKRFMRSTSVKHHMRLHGETSDKGYVPVSTNGISPTHSTQMPSVTSAVFSGPKVSSIGCKDSPQLDQQMNMNTRVKKESFIAPNVSRDSNVPVESVKSPILESFPGANKPESPLVTSQQSAATLHTKSQLIEKPHKCQVCGIRFRQEGVLKKHLQLHETGILNGAPRSSEQVEPERYLKIADMVTNPQYSQRVIPEANLKLTDSAMHNHSSKQIILVTGDEMAGIVKETQNKQQVIPVMGVALAGTQYSQPVIPVTGMAMAGIVNDTQSSHQVKPETNHKMTDRVRETQASKEVTSERNLRGAIIEIDTQNEQVIPVTGGEMSEIVKDTQYVTQMIQNRNLKMANTMTTTQYNKQVIAVRGLEMADIVKDTQIRRQEPMIAAPDMGVSHPQYRAQCSYCSEVFTHEPDFRVHMMTHKKIKGNVRKKPARKIKEYYSPTHTNPVHNVPKASETGLVQLCSESGSDCRKLQDGSHSQKPKQVLQLKQCPQDGNPNVSLNIRYAPKMGPPYNCGICNREFPYLSALKWHMQSHSQEQSHKGPVCNTEPTPSLSIKQHAMGDPTKEAGTHIINEHSLAQLTEKPPLTAQFGFSECFECIQGFSNPQGLVAHIMTNHKQQAQGALAPYARQESTKAARYNWGGCHQCPQCIKGYTDKKELMAHMALHRNDQDLRPSSSGGVSYLSEPQVVSSIDGHRQSTKPYSCHLCGVRFRLLTNFWQHLTVHN